MAYKLVYTKRAKKDADKLNPPVKKRIGKKIISLRKTPRKKSKKLINPELGTYRYRIGDYRIIFDIDNKKVVVLRIQHRKDVYK